MSINSTCITIFAALIFAFQFGVAHAAPGLADIKISRLNLFSSCAADLDTNTYLSGRLPVDQLANLKPGTQFTLYQNGSIFGGVRIISTNEEFTPDSNYGGLLKLYQRQSHDLGSVFLLTDGRYIYGNITGGDFFLNIQTDNPYQTGEVEIDGEHSIRVGDIRAFGDAIRDASAIETLIQNLPPAPENAAVTAIRQRVERYKGLTIDETIAYDGLLSLVKGARYDLFTEKKNTPPLDAIFWQLEDTISIATDKRDVIATFEIKEKLGSSSSSILKVPISRFVVSAADPLATKYSVFSFNSNPKTRATDQERKILALLNDRSQAVQLDTIYFNPAYSTQYRPAQLALTFTPGSLEVFDNDGYYWVRFNHNGRNSSALLRSVNDIKFRNSHSLLNAK